MNPEFRFYAGSPLILDDGACVGTLCILGIRPRFLEGSDLARLRDLADLTVHEIQGARRLNPPNLGAATA